MFAFRIWIYRTEQYLWVYVLYLRMDFLDIGIKKHHHRRQEHLWLKESWNGDGDCVTFHRLTAYHLFLEATFTTGMSLGYPLWSTSELFFTKHWTEFIGNMPTPTTTRAFVGYLSFFRGKVRVTRFTQKPCGLKNVFKAYPGYQATSISSK